MAIPYRSSRAENDLLEIWRHIAHHDPAAADRQLEKIDAAAKMLAENPKVGFMRDDLARGMRSSLLAII